MSEEATPARRRRRGARGKGGSRGPRQRPRPHGPPRDDVPIGVDRPSVAERLAAVDGLLDGTVTDAGGLWSRATAWILRIALEQVVDELWIRVAPELVRCPMRAQLLALRTFAGPLTAARIATLWSALSHAAHHHDYELAPGVTELRRWREETARIADELAGIG
ncbi:hypothetical protein [Nocardia cyriacigeorgica]|uniref:hypothetical protein n=1 Tax=Nocardia cyriacigeorgica TaxID=135487 RepID=UPI00245894E3|nr:hypothetical protein [Nocardia cyriacigeorgica]